MKISSFSITTGVKINKWLPGSDQIQGILSKTWSKDEAEDVVIKSFVKTSEISRKMPQRTIHSNNSTYKKLKAVVRQQPQHKPKVEELISQRCMGVAFV